ncbi:hypothetical protein EYR41_009039 [Orbilia oligospora]|uniref:Uncharacterized protein n=1 Tax=Orbilia oligospora TaxID=2813651 RepID=A0A8H2DW80_ORBOL|nr:hypothetical protein EYR41_009039 [Orbilia oligospora]
MKDIISNGLKVISSIAALAGSVFNSALHLVNSPSPPSPAPASPSTLPASSYTNPQRAAMHVPNPHDYDTGGDMGRNETHHTLHSSGATAMMGGPNKVLFFLTLIVGLWMVCQMITPVNAGVIKRQGDEEEQTGTSTSTETETVTETEGPGAFTYYQLNGDGTTETPVVQEGPPESSGSAHTGGNGEHTTIFPSTHDGTVHNHVSVVTEPETTEFITDIVIETDVVTITISDLEATDGEGGFQTSVVTHTGTWYHTHLPNEEAHTASWTHKHTVTGPPGSGETITHEGGGGEAEDKDKDGHWPGDPDGEWDKDGDGHGPPGGPGTGDGTNPNDDDGDGHWQGDPDSKFDKDGDGHGPPGGPGTKPKDEDGDGHYPGDPDIKWDEDGDGHGPPGGAGTGTGTNPKDDDGDGDWPGDGDGKWDDDGDGHGPPGGPGTGDGDDDDDDDDDDNDDDGNDDDDGPSSHHAHPTCSFDIENHTSDIDEQIHHSTHVPGENTLTWAHDITLTYETTKTLIFGGTTYEDVITSTITEEEEIIVTSITKTLIEDGVTYTDVDVFTTTKFGEIEVSTITREIVDGGTTYEEIATVTTTDLHFDPVTTIDGEEWSDHTKTHSHNGGPTEYLPEHTHHHTFTIPTTYTSTITTDTSVIYTEWVGAITITL